MNIASVNHNGHFEIPEVAIELFIMKVLAPTWPYLRSNIFVFHQESLKHLNFELAIDCAKDAINKQLTQFASEISNRNTDMTDLAIIK
jgi:hypothetical protein